ncbi:MAG: DUF1761 domain-containing protein [Ignavibacteriae bacterium]|nr:DUF1761 domain-containing protein [Ignavibacteriota bacterium]
MDMGAAFQSLNWLAVLAATFSAFILGGIWYSPVMFAAQWMQAAGISEEMAKNSNPAKTFGGAFVFILITAINLGMFLGPQSDLATGIAAGAATGIGFVATSFGVIYLFEQRPKSHWFVNASYLVVMFIIMGAILGAWH